MKYKLTNKKIKGLLEVQEAYPVGSRAQALNGHSAKVMGHFYREGKGWIRLGNRDNETYYLMTEMVQRAKK